MLDTVLTEEDKNIMLDNGIKRIKAYENVINKIRNGVPETKACKEEGVVLTTFRRFIRTNYNQEQQPMQLDIKEDSTYFTQQDRFFHDLIGTHVPEPDNFNQNLEIALARITTRSAEIIRLYYIEGWACEEIGTKLGLTKMRVSQLVKKAMRELRTVDNINVILFGNSLNNKLEQEHNEFLEKFKERVTLENKRKWLNDLSKDLEACCEYTQTELEDKIDNMGLSTRLTNSLHRQGLFVLRDIINYNNNHETWHGFSGLGVKSLEELAVYLNEHYLLNINYK
jgi:RNA polymerase sigma factor (sigma-70 family)